MDRSNSGSYDPARSSLGWPASHSERRRLEHLLVVVDAATLEAEDPRHTPLLGRTAAVAAALGCRVTLYAACADTPKAARHPYGPQAESVVDHVATRLDEFCLRLDSQGIPATPLAVWEPQEADEMLDRIREIEPDLLLKSGSSRRFFAGLAKHPDWELLRQARIPIWYVVGSGDKSIIRHVLTALGSSEHPEEVTGAHDYDVCSLGNLIAAGCSASNTILHTYLPPQYPPTAVAYPAEATPLAGPAPTQDRQAQVAEHHQRVIAGFARLFGIDQERVILRPGRLVDAVAEVVESTASDLVVMGARNLTRLQRLLKPVNAEPVLTGSSCDVVILPERAAETATDSLTGESRIDLETAMVNPEAVFGSPAALADCDDLSAALRLRLLRIWESDVRAEMREEEEGGPVGPTRAGLLQRIHRARERLGTDSPAPGQPEFS